MCGWTQLNFNFFSLGRPLITCTHQVLANEYIELQGTFCHNVFVFSAMATELCKSNRYHSAKIWSIPILLMVNGFFFFAKLALKWSPKRKSRLVKLLLIFLTEVSGISFYWDSRYPAKFSEKSLEENSGEVQNSVVKLFWNFESELLWGGTSHQFQIFDSRAHASDSVR